MTTTRYLNIPKGKDGWPTSEGVRLAEDLILAAMAEDARHPVTVGFYETRVEWRHPKRGTGPAKWYRVPGQYVHAVRTFEFFDFDGTPDGVYFTGIDRCPLDEDHPARPHAKPGIRTVVARRITDITVHRQLKYSYPNRYFIDQVRAHAEQSRQRRVSSLTDDAIWHMISLARDPQDAARRAGLHTVSLVKR